MTTENLLLFVASYPDETSASTDFAALKSAEDALEVKIVSAAVVTRDLAGKVDVTEHDSAAGRHAVGWGAVGGLLVGLFAPPLLAATAVGAAAGGVLHEIAKHHEEHEVSKDAEEYLPPGSSAVLAIVDDEYADRLDHVLAKANKRVRRAIDSGSFARLSKALDSADEDVDKALES